MKNLFGLMKCDPYIRTELEGAGIEIVDDVSCPTDIRSTLRGQLGKAGNLFIFKRAWNYWMVSGNVPLKVANELYAHAIGREDVRVAGHRDCPSPDEQATEHTTLGQVVTSYHIDSQEGLNLFVETLREHGVV